MIQRKQTLFLLMAAILMIFTLFVPFQASEQLHFSAFNFSAAGLDEKISVLPVGIYIIFVAVLQLFTIMLFKNRKIQMRFAVLSLLLSLGFYGLLFFYHSMLNHFVEIDLKNYSFSLFAPFLAAIFDFMAYGGIKKDEKLIRDSERLR